MAEANGGTEQQIIELEHEWVEAIARRDAETLGRLLGDDFTIAGWLPNGKIERRFSLMRASVTAAMFLPMATYSRAQWLKGFASTAI